MENCYPRPFHESESDFSSSTAICRMHCKECRKISVCEKNYCFWEQCYISFFTRDNESQKSLDRCYIDILAEQDDGIRYPLAKGCMRGVDYWRKDDCDESLLAEVSKNGIVVFQRD